MDRIMLTPVLYSMSGLAAGITHREKRSNAPNEAMVQVACCEWFGNDLAIIEYGLHGAGIMQGNKISDPENSVPATLEYAVRDLSELYRLELGRTATRSMPWRWSSRPNLCQ